MDKNTCTRIKLGKGEMHLYECGKLRLHAYKTNDFMDDEVFLLEKDGRAVAIESPCFFDNNRELEAYMRDKGLEAAGVLLAYHMAGASFLPHTRKFSTRNAEAYVCVSVTEKDGGSLYLTQLWFGPSGDLLGKHRKMKATSNEMTVWGDGDASMMPVFATEYGNLGGLQCWEHYIPHNVATMAAKNEQVHVSAWPIGMPDPSASFADEQCAVGAQYYALATGTFTLCASQIWTPEMEEKLCRSDAQRQAMAYGHGFTRIISPTGQVIAKMEHDAEGVLVADIDLGLIPVAKYFMDPAGHYSTPGNMQLFVDASRQKPVFILGEEDPEGLSYEDIQFEVQ